MGGLLSSGAETPYTEKICTYAEVDGQQLQIKVYRPETAVEAPPCIIFFAGSAFAGTGFKIDSKWLSFFLDRGFAMVVCPYRGHRGKNSGQVHFPTPLFEAVAALRYLRKNAESIGIDAKRIVSMGASSGGWYSVMMAVSGSDKFKEAGLLGSVGDGLEAIQAGVCCAVDFYGPMDFELFEAEFDAFRGKDGDGSKGYWKFLGVSSWPDDLSEVQRASPLSYLGQDTPPIFVAHGVKDVQVSVTQSEALVERLKEQNVRHELHLLPDGCHASNHFKEPDFLQKVHDFITTHLPH